jgi:hypothetical protein
MLSKHVNRQEGFIMSVSPIAAGTVSAPPPVRPQDPTQASASAPAPTQAPKKDTVTISKQAVQLASDGDTAAVEAKESAAEKATENLRGKK